MISFVDESVKQDGVGAYVVASVIVPTPECQAIRAKLLEHPRFHFYRASEPRRRGMAAAIGGCRLLTSAYVYRGLFPIGQENARSRCVRRLLADLAAWGVDELVIESRHGHGDRRDRITVMSALNSRTAPPNLAYSWAEPGAEPVLWMADAIAGMVRVNINAPTYANELRRLGTVIRQVR